MFLKILMVVMLSASTMFSFAQRRSNGNTSPDERKNFLPMEGGGKFMPIDQITPLPDLINRLAEKWDFEETNKMYWIGYTQDMFSIAARGDEAIDSLVAVLKAPKNTAHWLGAIYTLHLIGIDRTIAGRTYEEFVNPKARKALQGFLKDTMMQEDIVRLLIRDAWLSDVPALMEALDSCPANCWSLVAAITRFDTIGLPVCQKIPDEILAFKVSLKPKEEEKLIQDYSESEKAWSDQIKNALHAFRQLKPERIKVEEAVFNQSLAGDFATSLSVPMVVAINGAGNSQFVEADSGKLTMGNFISDVILDKWSGYSSIGTKLQYYVEDGRMYFCTIETARERLLAWWKNLTAEERSRFISE